MRLQKESDLKKESEKNKTSENRNKKLKKTEKNERKIKRIDSAIERKVEKKINFYAKKSEIKRVMFLYQPMIVLLYKVAYLNTNKLDASLPSSIVSLL